MHQRNHTMHRPPSRSAEPCAYNTSPYFLSGGLRLCTCCRGGLVSGFQIRAFTPDDIPQVMALQQEYQRCYPHASVIPGEVYLSPGFESGVNIFCAMDQQGCLQGYAPVLPSLTMEPDLPNIVWAEVKAKPLDPIARETKDLLF